MIDYILGAQCLYFIDRLIDTQLDAKIRGFAGANPPCMYLRYIEHPTQFTFLEDHKPPRSDSQFGHSTVGKLIYAALLC